MRRRREEGAVMPGGAASPLPPPRRARPRSARRDPHGCQVGDRDGDTPGGGGAAGPPKAGELPLRIGDFPTKVGPPQEGDGGHPR